MKKTVFALLVLILPLPLRAQFLPDGKWWTRPRLAAEIGLTSEQKRELEKIFARTRPKLIDLKADLEKKQFEFQQAMEEGNPADSKAIGLKIEAREQARARLQKELAVMVLDMKQVLKPEQWDRLRQWQQERLERLEERRRMFREETRREEYGRPEGRRPPGDPPQR